VYFCSRRRRRSEDGVTDGNFDLHPLLDLLESLHLLCVVEGLVAHDGVRRLDALLLLFPRHALILDEALNYLRLEGC